MSAAEQWAADYRRRIIQATRDREAGRLPFSLRCNLCHQLWDRDQLTSFDGGAYILCDDCRMGAET